MTKKICAVIVTYNPELTQLNCLVDTLAKQCLHVIVVDNFSKKNDFITSTIEGVEFIRLEENYGIGYAQNVGLKRSLELACTHTILFDQDSKIQADLISILQTEADTHDKCAAIGPCFINSNDRVIYPQIKIKNFKPSHLYLSSPNVTEDVSYLIASGCMIKNSALNVIGFMNESFFIDFVDIEWCLRALHLGFEIKATNKACIEHYIGSSRKKLLGKTFSTHQPFRRYYMTRNSVHLSKMKYAPLGYRLYLITFGMVKIILHSLILGNGFSHFKMSLKGAFDGIRGITGKLNGS